MKLLTLGVDISLSKIDLAYWSGSKSISVGEFPNAEKGFWALEKAVSAIREKLQTQNVVLVMEPTGGYEQKLARFAVKKEWLVCLPNPYHVRRWAQGIGQRAKTDRQDAMILARYGAENQPPQWQPPSQAVEVLEDLLSRKEDLQKMLGAEKNRLHAHQNKPVVCTTSTKSLEQSIAFIEQQIVALESAIVDHINDTPCLFRQRKHLLSVPGVGKKNVLFLLVLLSRFSELTDGKGLSKSLVAYVGLDPVPHQSGSRVKKPSRISRQGNKRMRKYLFLGALGGIKGNSPLSAFYHRLVGRGKAKMVALIASARKILVWSWAIFQQSTMFDATRFCEN